MSIETINKKSCWDTILWHTTPQIGFYLLTLILRRHTTKIEWFAFIFFQFDAKEISYELVYVVCRKSLGKHHDEKSEFQFNFYEKIITTPLRWNTPFSKLHRFRWRNLLTGGYKNEHWNFCVFSKYRTFKPI